MKMLAKIFLAVGVTCIGLGVILVGVSLITGGGVENVMNHQIVPPYLDAARAEVEALLRSVLTLVSPTVG